MKSIIFAWRGIDQNGKKIFGEIEAENISRVKAILRKQGIYLQFIRKKKYFFLKKRISQTEIIYFTRQIATMLKAGISLISAFETIIKSHANFHMRKLINTIKTDIEAGSMLYQALNKHPQYFNNLYCNLAAVGEQTGKLDELLEKLAHYKENMKIIKSKIYRALYYPVIVLLVAVFITMGLLVFVVPQFVELFNNFHATLPLLTRCIINASNFFQSYFIPIFITLTFLCILFIYQFKNNKKFRDHLDQVLLKIPFIGIIIKKSAIAKFTQTLGVTFAAGIPLIEGIQTAAKVTGNNFFQQRIENIAESLSQGKLLHHAMRDTHLFSEIILQMILIGEESGTLENMLKKITEYHQEEINHLITTLGIIVEPVIMIILSILVGGLIIAMYLPIFNIGTII